MGLIKYIGYKVGMLLLQLQLHLEYPGVEHYHHQAGDVEGAQAGPDDEVGVVEGAHELAKRKLERSRSSTFLHSKR